MTTIENQEEVTSIFGSWPSFHDAEIHRLVMERDGADGPSLELAIHLARSLVNLRFTRIAGDGVSGFNEQNAIFHLEISDLSPEENEGRRFRVSISSSYGLGGLFDCERIIVTGVRPFAAAV